MQIGPGKTASGGAPGSAAPCCLPVKHRHGVSVKLKSLFAGIAAVVAHDWVSLPWAARVHSLRPGRRPSRRAPDYCTPRVLLADQIDQALACHYGFTDQELDFILNYDIKYRLGHDTENEEE